MLLPQITTTLFFGAGIAVAAATPASAAYNVPKTQPSNAAEIDATPVGPSFEFFMWPSYMRNITPVLDCLERFDELYGQPMPIRIGGTTQDRATYDPKLKGYVSYHVDHLSDAPMSLIYGPRFFNLISEYGAQTTIGLNRALDNRTNTWAAVMELNKRAGKHVEAIELGNEPDLYLEFWQYPIATPLWDEAQEGADAADWIQDFAKRWKGKRPILAAGGYAIPFPYKPNWPNLPYLIDHSLNESTKAAVKEYNGHIYAFSDAVATGLQGEMNHTRVVQDLTALPVQAALDDGKPYIIGETGFHATDFEMDEQFGGAIHIADKTLRALSLGVKRLYYHQGTIDYAFFNWWYYDQVNTPFYGGYMSALATVGADHITADDDGTTLFAQYTLFKKGRPFKLVLINTDYYDGNGKRNWHTYDFTNLAEGKVEVVRMTAPDSLTKTTKTTKAQEYPSQEVTIAGQYFSNRDCSIMGKEKRVIMKVKGGKLSVKIHASEAVIVHLK
ncbi:hypothetical protein EDB80DRAFT_810009 [Ilyonectria destructans]|nr:hypothetical protein EDB80DRAFT_810009 [Ilyonectria destructans]